MKISVVIATYNGERFFTEQLDSILGQSRKADEIVVVDDCSTDTTSKIIERYSADCAEIRFYENEKNKGWRKNFHEAILKSSGDIIVLCDQDDIWYKNKLETTEYIFSQYAHVELLASEFDEMEDEKLKKKKGRKELLTQVAIDGRLIHTYYPGCTYAFRRDLFERISPFWNDALPHDAQLGIAARIFHSMFIYGNSLIVYRRHQNNATKRTVPSIEKKRDYVSAERCYIEFAYQIIDSYGSRIHDLDTTKRILCEIKHYLENREVLLERATPKQIVRAFAHINNYYSARTCLGDIAFALKYKGE